VIVLTNQSGIARGFLDEAAMHSIHKKLKRQLNGLIDNFYFCPHGPNDGCGCRKPGTEMIKQAASDYAIDLANSWIVGDKRSDIETGFNSGIATALVMTGYGEVHLAALQRMPDIIAQNLFDAARQICSR
jgi:D-glycero-D-manno-heptose 1,7-bisphosphate phosphatase